MWLSCPRSVIDESPKERAPPQGHITHHLDSSAHVSYLRAQAFYSTNGLPPLLLNIPTIPEDSEVLTGWKSEITLCFYLIFRYDICFQIFFYYFKSFRNSSILIPLPFRNLCFQIFLYYLKSFENSSIFFPLSASWFCHILKDRNRQVCICTRPTGNFLLLSHACSAFNIYLCVLCIYTSIQRKRGSSLK